MSNTAAFPPPQNPGDLGRGPMIMGLTWTFTGLAVITTLLRFYLRKRTGPRPFADDWLMLAAMVFQLICQVFVTISFTYGLGKHQYDLYIPDQVVPMAMWTWLAVIPGLMAGMLGRISVCVLLVRLFGKVHKWFKYYAIILTGGGVATCIVTSISIYVANTPVVTLWNPFVPVTSHWDPHVVQDMMFLTQSLFALADLTFVLIPIVFIWKLHMNLNRRLALIALMAVGLFTCAMSIMKGVSAISSQTGNDAAYQATLSCLWATLEQACVVLLGNVAPLRPLAKLTIPIFSNIAEYIGSLLGLKSINSGKTTAGRTKGHQSGQYQDLEMDAHKGGTTSEVWHEVISSGSLSEYNSGKTIPEGQVRRTDAFTVVYTPAPPESR